MGQRADPTQQMHTEIRDARTSTRSCRCRASASHSGVLHPRPTEIVRPKIMVSQAIPIRVAALLRPSAAWSYIS